MVITDSIQVHSIISSDKMIDESSHKLIIEQARVYKVILIGRFYELWYKLHNFLIYVILGTLKCNGYDCSDSCRFLMRLNK